MLVGLVVGWVSRASASEPCGADLQGKCRELAHAMSLRMGVTVGVVTVLMLLTVAGLYRMMLQDELRRAEVAGE